MSNHYNTISVNIFQSFTDKNIRIYHVIDKYSSKYSKLYLVNDKKIIAKSKNICEFTKNDMEYIKNIINAQWESESLTNITMSTINN